MNRPDFSGNSCDQHEYAKDFPVMSMSPIEYA